MLGVPNEKKFHAIKSGNICKFVQSYGEDLILNMPTVFGDHLN